MLRKILLGLAPAVAIAAIAVGSQTSTAALAVDEVNVVSQNVQFAKPGAGIGSTIRGGIGQGVHHGGIGRPKTGIKTGIRTGNKAVHSVGVS